MNQTNSEDGWWCFLALCNQMKTSEDLNEFFKLFLTIEERNDVADRFLIVRDLLAGEKPQREIAEELQVSIAKITRGSNSLKIVGEDFRNFLLKKLK